MIFYDILLPIFLLIAVGAAFSRFLRAELDPLAQYALFVATPALVFSALVRHPLVPDQVVRLVGHMVLYTAILWAVADLAARGLGFDAGLRRAFVLATVPMNIGNYGLPLVRFAFGPEAEPFSILVFVVYSIPLCTWAIWVAAGGGLRTLQGMGATLKIPIFHAAVLAAAVVSLGWTVPAPVGKAVGLVGGSAIPVLLVILGMQLHRNRAGTFGWSLAVAAVVRLVVGPLVAWGLAEALGFRGVEQKVLVLQTATPTAVLVLLYALRFGSRPDWIASAILVTTLASAASVTAVLWLLL